MHESEKRGEGGVHTYLHSKYTPGPCLEARFSFLFFFSSLFSCPFYSYMLYDCIKTARSEKVGPDL